LFHYAWDHGWVEKPGLGSADGFSEEFHVADRVRYRAQNRGDTSVDACPARGRVADKGEDSHRGLVTVDTVESSGETDTVRNQRCLSEKSQIRTE
jgi:hypothetical protein